jgi:hypothetical protein
MPSIDISELPAQPRLASTIHSEPRPSLTPSATRTSFRLAVTQVGLNDSGTLERALRQLTRIEWGRFDYSYSTETLRVEGNLPCALERALDVYLPQLTYCVWDVVCSSADLGTSAAYPKVLLYLHPDEADEQRHSLTAHHFGQYKRRRREFEGYGGNVLERWGLAPAPGNTPEGGPKDQ